MLGGFVKDTSSEKRAAVVKFCLPELIVSGPGREKLDVVCKAGLWW